MSYFFNILVHHSLVPALRGCDQGLQRQVQKTLENLQLGCWQGGTRVKVLKGVRKLVYEARVNRSLRLLFTVSRAFAPKPPHDLEHYLLAWDLVDHDHIDRAKRMNIQPETGFLDFEPLLETDIEDAPVAPEAVLEQPPADCESLAQLINDPARCNEDQDELTESIRWFELDPDIIIEPDEWQALLDDPGAGDFELKLSLEQAERVFEPGPVLLRGTAGSGKTTVCIYRLARAAAERPGARLLLVTYSQPLLASAQRLFRDLYRARRQPLPDAMPDFYTFPQLYQAFTGRRHQELRLMRFPMFDQWYTRIYGRDDSALAWEEIRGIIKGAQLDLSEDALDQEAYEQLGRKRAPLFIAERPRLYQVYRKYQAWCRQGGFIDDIDLARGALRALRQDPALCYDEVICDEGQDLTELELRFLLELTRSPSALLFTADPQQIVNPSGFRWSELRSLLRHPDTGQTPDIRSLSRNYRSAHSIVAIANALLTLQRLRTGRSDDDELQETTLHGPAPVLVTGDETGILQQLKGFGPRCAVITGTAEEAERVSHHLESERVFDIVSAKGLEFDACVVWNLFSRDRDLWQRLLCTEDKLKEDPVARRAIHHTYVAVTRARRYLGIYEAEPAAITLWQTPTFRAHLELDEADALGKFMLHAASPGEWAQEGDYFLERGRYKQAAECYRRAGSERQAEMALAAFEESIGNHRRAADRFLELGYPQRAAPCLERCGRYAEAAAAYDDHRQWADAARCYEQCGQLQRAAECFQSANDTAAYRRCLRAWHEQQRNWAEAAKIAEKQQDLSGASKLYQKGGHHQRALAMQLEDARGEAEPAELAELLERSGQLDEAAAAWRQAGHTQQASRCEAEAAERRKDHQAAADAWQQAGEETRAALARARLAEEQLRWYDAAHIYHYLGREKQVSTCLRRASEPEAEIWLKALDARTREPITAADHYLQLEMVDEARQALRLARERLARTRPRQLDWPDEWEELEAGEERLIVIDQMLVQGLAQVADENLQFPATVELLAEHWAAAGDPAHGCRLLARYDCYAAAAELAHTHDLTTLYHRYQAEVEVQAENWAPAASHYEQCGNTRDHAKCTARHLEQNGDLLAAADWYDRCRMTAQARRCREEASHLTSDPDERLAEP